MELLANKQVLVVGGTGGIGAEVARLLRSSQANVFITGRNADDLAVAGEAAQISADQRFLMDITNPDQISEVAAAIHQRIGKLDILVNAAGVGIIKPMEQLSLEDFQHTLAVNLTGTFLLLKNFLPPMKEAKKGLIINMPGVLGKSPMAGAAAYAASKYGLNGMLKSVREELKRTDIRITNIYLGGVDTPFWDEIDLRVQRDKFIQRKEAARAVWFLCQQPSSGVVSEMVIQPFNHQVL
ncbi:MAG: SDR family oxidoreductase [Lewinellaceae bacterium]|nr:SDR family oxidoreductase [Lewinellaceae bacterium]